MDLGRKSKDLVQEGLQLKKARNSEIKPEEGQEEFEEETDSEKIFLPSGDHSPILKGNQNSFQQNESSSTASFPSLTRVLHQPCPQQEEL